MVEVMKLGDGGETRLQHLDIGLSSDRFDVVGGDRKRETIHRVAPGPETVGRLAALFRKAGHGALERMRMQIADARGRRSRSVRRRARPPSSGSTAAIVAPSIRTRTSEAQPCAVSARSKCNVVIVLPARLTSLCLYIRRLPKPRGEGSTMTPASEATTIWRNARLATLALGAPGLGVVDRGAIVARAGRIVFAGPEPEAPTVPNDARTHRLRGPLDHARADRLPHPPRLRGQPGGASSRCVSPARATRRSRAQAAASSRLSARRARRARTSSFASRCRVSTR